MGLIQSWDPGPRGVGKNGVYEGTELPGRDPIGRLRVE